MELSITLCMTLVDVEQVAVYRWRKENVEGFVVRMF